MDLEVEAYLRPPEMEFPPYPPKVITLATGGKMVVRQATREDVPKILQAVRPTIKVERDFYDIVGARVYAELLGWYRYRVRDMFCLIGQIDGLLVGQVNTRSFSEKVDISLHTLAIERGLRIWRAPVRSQDGILYRIPQPGRSAHHGREPDRVPALDDRVRSRAARRTTRTRWRRTLCPHARTVFQTQGSPGGWRAPCPR